MFQKTRERRVKQNMNCKLSLWVKCTTKINLQRRMPLLNTAHTLPNQSMHKSTTGSHIKLKNKKWKKKRNDQGKTISREFYTDCLTDMISAYIILKSFWQMNQCIDTRNIWKYIRPLRLNFSIILKIFSIVITTFLTGPTICYTAWDVFWRH